MNWLQRFGDKDILRETTRPSAIFLDRARRGFVWVVLFVLLTAFLAGLGVMIGMGPEGTGVFWATRERVAVVFSAFSVIWLIYSVWILFKFLPSRNDRIVLKLRHFVLTQIDPLEEQVRGLSDDQMRAKAAEFKGRLAEGESLDAIRPEAYALVREASRRAREHRQFECQLIGGKVLEENNVAEMRTGEGKTIVCYLGNYMKILQGFKVHLVTVNDYLVKRDADFCRPIFDLLGVTVGHISAEMDSYGAGVEIRRQAYACDITYGTNSELGFDYLRDNMKHSTRDQVQGPLNYVVVDEVDSILIDEARTPLIISGPAHDDVSNYRVADNVARSLIRKQEQANRETTGRIAELETNPPPGADKDPKFKDGLKKFKTDPFWLSSEEAEAIGHMQYFVVEMDRKSAHMTEHGAKAAQEELSIGTFYDSKNMNWPHYIDNALRAHRTYLKDKEYVIQDDTIVIVDEFTGRLMLGRQWSDGLHQAVEAKEKVTIKQETQTLATITLQNFFKLYDELAGMTGTAMTEAEEFMKIYKLEVIAIPTNMPVRRIDYNDKIYKTKATKTDAIVEEICSYSRQGYPSDPWSLQDMLKQARRTLGEVGPDGEEASGVQEQIAIIDEALGEFADGKGDEKALEDGYLKLMDGQVGGRPVLVGTASVESSEFLSQALSRRHGIEHEVLNAKNHAREAEIIAKAGQQHETSRGKKKHTYGNVTIATNMAGRGTDIVLGEGVSEIGGLHVVGTDRHESRRIDNQLRGRGGRQGDPGSSRFFLSLDDDLLRLFMGEWVLKMLNLLGFEEDMAIEDKRLNKGIARAQKKVEERNFGIRKNLLEYDEVMDHQRKTFYAMRQRVVEGRGLSELIWEMIDETVADAVDRYFDPQYAAHCVVEWIGQHLGITLEANKIDAGDLELLQEQVRDLAGIETRSHVQRTFGEYVDTTLPPEEWDLRGLTRWVVGYGLSLTQKQVREAEPDELLEQIIEAAVAKIDAEDLSPLEQYVDPLYGRARLARWARDKFDVEIALDDLATAQREDAERVIGEKMREAYRRREIEYPCGAVLDFALQRGGTNLNEVYARIAAWVKRKYGLDWTFEHFAGKDPKQIYDELVELNQDYLTNGKLDTEIDAALAEHPGEEIVKWARARFGVVVDLSPVEPGPGAREQLQRCGYEMLRFELTQLERYVLITTFDQVWKDHMYSMDLLRHGIGLRGYAEKDPKIEYKREGTRLFNEMMRNIRERVTDLIFKVRVTPPGGADDLSGAVPAAPAPGAGGGSAYAGMTAAKADATNAAFASAAEDQQAAMSKQGEGGKPQPIRRDVPKVGRNAPCPCGSGKKFKNCHGKGK